LVPLQGFAVLAVGSVAQEQEGYDLDGKLAVFVEAEGGIAPLRLFDVAGTATRRAGSAG